MAENFRRLSIAVAVVVLAAGALVWRGCRGGADVPSGGSGDFSADGVVLSSPDLELELVGVRGTAKSNFTDWTCLFECRESDGCRAGVRVRVLYRSAGEKHTLQLSGRFDAALGETMRIGRVQRPATAVERVDEVVVEVVASVTRGGPLPTPVQ